MILLSTKIGSCYQFCSLAADGMEDRYTGRDGTNPGGGFRTGGKIEYKGPRSSLFKVNTTLRSPSLGEEFNRSSSGIYYRFPAGKFSANSGTDFPLRVSRISLNAGRNASDLNKILDDIDGTLGLSLKLPPMLLPSLFLPASSAKKPKPKIYPLGITFSSNVKGFGSFDPTTANEILVPYPFSPINGTAPLRGDWKVRIKCVKLFLIQAIFSNLLRLARPWHLA